jgi:sulfite reductase (NADPH) flavoprotein alpha-component
VIPFERLAWAAAVLACYGLLCATIILRARRKQAAARTRRESLDRPDGSSEPVLVAFASQTGHAEEIAWRTAASLQTAGLAVRLMHLSEITADTLARFRRALLIASTCGEGDPPDAAVGFVQRVMAGRPALAGLQYGVLALGDRTYANFCGFGRRLEGWLEACGAQALFERVEVDAGNEAALHQWQHLLGHLSGTREAPRWQAPDFTRWRLTGRRLLNAGSQGEPAFHVELVPAGGSLPEWEAGDLVQIRMPGDGRPREYSIASLPSDGALHLLVRRTRWPDGRAGHVSGPLCEGLPLGAEIEMRVRPHGNFRVAANAGRKLLLIGNGTGIAGLRAHIKAAQARASGGHWLVFGEREAAHDSLYADDIAAWLADGTLGRVDLVFSRDQSERRYVQHRLAEAATGVRSLVAWGGAIYVCGSLEGMAAGVDAALRDILGEETLAALAGEGRYRRDVY